MPGCSCAAPRRAAPGRQPAGTAVPPPSAAPRPRTGCGQDVGWPPEPPQPSPTRPRGHGGGGEGAGGLAVGAGGGFIGWGGEEGKRRVRAGCVPTGRCCPPYVGAGQERVGVEDGVVGDVVSTEVEEPCGVGRTSGPASTAGPGLLLQVPAPVVIPAPMRPLTGGLLQPREQQGRGAPGVLLHLLPDPGHLLLPAAPWEMGVSQHPQKI